VILLAKVLDLMLAITLKLILTVDEQEEDKILLVQLPLTLMQMEVNLEEEAVLALELMEDRYLLMVMEQVEQMLSTREMVNLRTTKEETHGLEGSMTEMGI